MNQARRILPLYAPQGHAEFLDGESFVTRIWLSAQVTPQVEPERIEKILTFCHTARTRDEIQQELGLNDREYFRKEILQPLIAEGLLEMTNPDKPNSPLQKYQTRRDQP